MIRCVRCSGTIGMVPWYDRCRAVVRYKDRAIVHEVNSVVAREKGTSKLQCVNMAW